MEPWKYISDSLRGLERDENKDRTLIVPTEKNLLAVLFDGISSASEAGKGIDIAVESIQKNHRKLESSDYGLDDLMFDAHSEILASGLSTPFTTFSAAYLSEGGVATFCNLGDSRIYEITPQYIKQLSSDDNLMHNKNIVTKYLGMLTLERSEMRKFQRDIIGKRILLCSDGFYYFLEESLARFHEILNFKSLSNIQKSLETKIGKNNLDDSSYILLS